MRISATGLVTSVGLSTAATAAAVRAGISNAQATRFIDWGGESIAAHSVPIEGGEPGARLLRMATTAVGECWHAADSASPPALIVCLAEPSRPGAIQALGPSVVHELANASNIRVSASSTTIAAGRVGGLLALQHARRLMREGAVDSVLIVGVDSYIHWPTLSSLENRHRLLTSRNSNGFIAGEAAAAVMVTCAGTEPGLYCEGLGFAEEAATIDSDLPLRADGLVEAIRRAAADARCPADDFGLHISSLSGEHYYFKETTLALTRLLRQPREDGDLWHPADCVGEVGAAAVPLGLAIAATACTRNYARASRILYHVSGDGRERAAAFLRHGAPQ